MSPVVYHILHLVGFMLLFMGFGASVHLNEKTTAMRLHGIGLVILLIAGFGLMAKLGQSYTSSWFIVKTLIWLALGALPVLRTKGILPARGVLAVAILLGGTAAALGYLKPAIW